MTAITAPEPTLDLTPRGAIATTQRPARASALSTSLTFSWRALLKIKHVPEQLGDVVGIPIIFTLLFTYLFGGALAGSTGHYLQFLLPGSLVMAVLMVSMYAGVGLNTDVTKGVFDRFRTLPIWRPSMIVGALLGDACRYLIASALVLALGIAMGYRPAGGAFGVLSAVALLLVFAFGLGWLWSTLGLLMRTPSALMNMAMLVLFPLTFASNVFVDPRTLPGWLHGFVDSNPITHLVTADRALMDGTATTAQISWVLIASAALTAVFAPLTMRIFRNKQ
ncbi:MAG TPA: ABC transporter permease [Acidothermaceae bacterium]